MKKLIILSLSFLILINVNAQYDPSALVVLDAMSSKYKRLEAFKASFSQKLINESVGLNEIIEGKITVKGKMYVLDVASQRIFNNGVDVYNYNPEIREVMISSYDPSEITVGNIYEIYKKGYKYALTKTNTNGDRIIELDSENRDKTYFKIKMTVNSRNELKSFAIYEKTGNKYVYSIDSFAPTSLRDSYFTFDSSKYPNVEVIDFR